jgi:biotin carboxyl carrier protein
MAGLMRLRVSDRANGTVVAEGEVGSADPGAAGAGEARRGALVLPLGDRRSGRTGSRAPQAVEVVVDGWRFEFDVEDADRADLRDRATSARDAAAHDGPTEVRAIIPGRVVSVAVNPGDAVATGARLLAVEAMKMENEVRAPRGGVVERVAVGPGDTVELGDVLVVIR